MTDIADAPSCPPGARDSTDESDEEEDSEIDDWEPCQHEAFNPHNLCECQTFMSPQNAVLVVI